MRDCVPLDPAARALSIQSCKPPLIFQMPVEQARQTLEEAQSDPGFLHPAAVSRLMFHTGLWGEIPVYLIAPENKVPSGVILYIHGAGWVLGSFNTHEKLVRELAARTGCMVIFPEYSRAPEAKYPVAIEQCYAVLCNIKGLNNDCLNLCLDNLTVAGDSVGGNMATVMTLLAKQRQGPKIQKQLLYYPVTDACMNTDSYRQFAKGYYLYRAGMEWFWQQYLVCPAQGREIYASPLKASLCELEGLPPAMILNGEADVLRDEGEAYGKCLRLAGVEVTALRFGGMIHDFVMLNALDKTKACRSAMDASVSWIREKNREAACKERVSVVECVKNTE